MLHVSWVWTWGARYRHVNHMWMACPLQTRSQCSVLKSPTFVKCHFGRQECFLWGGGELHRTPSAKFPPIIVKAPPKIVCHKIQQLHFANRNIDGFQLWRSSTHVHIPITPAILTLQLWLNIDCNFGLTNTTTRERGFSQHNWVRSDRRLDSNLKQ